MYLIFQNSDDVDMYLGSENGSYFLSPYNSLHLPVFAGLAMHFHYLIPLISKNLCHSWANAGELGKNSNLEKCVLK